MNGRRVAAFGLVGAGAAALASAPVVWLAGDRLLRIVRGREIASAAAIEILPRLLFLAGAACALAGGLLVSAGALFLRRQVAAPARAILLLRPRGAGLAYVAIVLVAASFGGVQLWLAGRSLSYDEILAVEADVRTPLRNGLSPRAWINHVSGSVLARGGRALFGESERGLRAPSVLLGALGIGGLGLWMLRTSGGVAAALLLQLALGANPLVLEMSPQIRGYSPMMWFGAAVVLWTTSSMLPMKLATSRGRDILTFLGILACSVFMGMSHLFGLVYLLGFACLVHGVLWTGRESPGRAVVPAAALALGSTVSMALSAPAFPWLFYMTGGRSTESPLERVRRELSILFLGRNGGAMLVAGLLVCLVVASIALVSRDRGVVPLVLVSTLPLVGLLAGALIARPAFFHARFLLLGLVLAEVTIALGVARLLQQLDRRIRVLAVASLFTGAVVGLAPGWTERLTDSWGYREAVRAVEGVARERFGVESVGIVPVGDWNSTTILRYYLGARLVEPVREADGTAPKTGGARPVVAVLVGQESDWGQVERVLEAASRPEWSAEIRGAANGSHLFLRGFRIP